MHINDYKAKKNDEETPRIIADKLHKMADDIDDCVIVIKKNDQTVETITTNTDGPTSLGLLEFGKIALLDDKYEEY